MGSRTRKTDGVEKKKAFSYMVQPYLHEKAMEIVKSRDDIKSLSLIVENAIAKFIKDTPKEHKNQTRIEV